MNYRPYLCNEEDQVALVLPALADWRKSLELAAANVAAAASGQLAVDDDDAVQMAKQADAHKLMSLLEANGAWYAVSYCVCAYCWRIQLTR